MGVGYRWVLDRDWAIYNVGVLPFVFCLRFPSIACCTARFTSHFPLVRCRVNQRTAAPFASTHIPSKSQSHRSVTSHRRQPYHLTSIPESALG